MKPIHKFLPALLSLFILLGCDDELDLSNPNSQIPEDFWLTAEHAIEGTNAIYTNLLNDGYYMRMTPALTDGRGDDFQQDTPWWDLAQVANFTALPTTAPVQWLWEAHYQAIFRANQVIFNVPDIDMDESLKNRLIGQAYFLRGFSYFNLANNFQVVPVITEPSQDDSDYYAETATQEALWQQIFDDFQQAKSLLPLSYQDVSGPDPGQVGRATKGAATGMLGKALLFREQWQAAASEFEEVVGYGVYALMEDYRDNFSPLSENNQESLFEVQFATPDQVGGTVYNYGGEPNANWMQVSSVGHTYAMDGYGYSDFLPTRWLYNAYKSEMTVDGNVDPRLLVTISSYEPTASDVDNMVYGVPWPHAEDAIYPGKYTHEGIPGYTTESQGGVERSDINYRILRYADILLMHAEALNELNRTSEAYAFIQQVRDRANLPDLATVKPNMTQAEMRDQIAHERALEFAIESIRIHDLIRWGWFYDEEKLAELREHDAEFNNWSPGKEYLPIPQRELDINPNLERNPAN